MARILRRRRATVVGSVVVLLLLAVGLSSLTAAGPLRRKPDPTQATTSRDARVSALRSIPFDKLDEDARAKVASVLSDIGLFRRMPIQVIQCDPKLYLFLVEHPDVVVNIWQVLGISQIALAQTGAGLFDLVDAAGTTGTVEYLYRSHDTHLIYGEGSYEGTLFPNPVPGQCLLVLKTGYVREPDGRYYVTTRLDAFMRVEHDGVKLLAKALQPLVGKVADVNFAQTTGFVGSLSRTAEVDQSGMQRLAGWLSNVPPDVRQEFAELASQIADQTASNPNAEAEEPSVVARRTEEVKAN